VLEESATPDVQCSIARGSFKDGRIGALGRPALRAVPGVDDFPGITAGAWQMRPLSRGYVEARSPNPAEAPAINPRYLSDATDRRAIIGGLRFVRRLFAAPALARYCGAEILPGRRSRATTCCSTMRGRRARRSITRPAPER
jgi:choline dehydrogenase